MTRWIIFILLLVGCSKPPAKSAEAPLPELNSEQLERVSLLNKSYLDVQALVSWGSKDVFRHMDLGPQLMVDNGLRSCELDNARPDDNAGSLPTKGYFFSIVDGEQCPIQIRHRTGYRVSDTTGVGHVDVSLEYEAVQESARKRSALQAYEIFGRLEVLKQKSGTRIGGRLSGELRLRGMNPIPIEFDVQLQDGTHFYQSTQSLRMRFADFTVFAEAARTRQEEKSVERFKLNGRSVEKTVFEKVVGGFLPAQGPFSF